VNGIPAAFNYVGAITGLLDQHHARKAVVPAAFNYVGAITGLLDQHHARKAVVKIPQVDRRNSALEIPDTPTTTTRVK